MKADQTAPRELAEYTFTVHIGDGVDREQLHIDLTQILGVCRIGRDWMGRLCFRFPEPFQHVIVPNGARYPIGSKKLTELQLALHFFNCHTKATT
jgi:hypothetical protein